MYHCKLVQYLASVLECEASFVATLWAFIGHLSQLMKMVMRAYLHGISCHFLIFFKEIGHKNCSAFCDARDNLCVVQC